MDVAGDSSPSQHTMGKRQGILRTGHKSNTKLIKSHSPSNRENKGSNAHKVNKTF